MAINDGMFTSNSAEYETPQDFFDELDSEFHFNTDVCATRENAKAAIYFTKEDDGLEKYWNGVCWMNPPYGRVIGKWIKKAYESARGGATIVCLVPARTDTAWWHDYCMKGEIRFIRGRLKFNNMDSAPFPSAIVIFRPPLLKRLFGG
jgi:phage N-6-adenine-methyltransferase